MHGLFLQDMFARLDPVKSEFGLKMLKKMGWVEGTPLGKTGVGHIVPPVLSFQVDRKGELICLNSKRDVCYLYRFSI